MDPTIKRLNAEYRHGYQDATQNKPYNQAAARLSVNYRVGYQDGKRSQR